MFLFKDGNFYPEINEFMLYYQMFRTFMKNQRLTGKDFDPTAPCNKESDFTFIFDH